MVEEYIQKIYEELLKEEQNSAKRISDLQIHLKETQAMIHLLEKTNDPNFESFTPRKVNSRNKQKIDELHAEMKEVEEAIHGLPYAADEKSGRSSRGITAGKDRCCMQV